MSKLTILITTFPLNLNIAISLLICGSMTNFILQSDTAIFPSWLNGLLNLPFSFDFTFTFTFFSISIFSPSPFLPLLLYSILHFFTSSLLLFFSVPCSFLNLKAKNEEERSRGFNMNSIFLKADQ